MSEAPAVESAVERVPLARLGAQGFGRWLEGWKQLRGEGWDVTVLVDRGETHAVALACRTRPVSRTYSAAE